VQAGRVAYAAHATFHEAVIDVEGGEAVLPATRAIVPSARLALDGRVRFRDATALGLGEGAAEDGSTHDLELEGALTADLQRRGDRIAAEVSGSLTRMAVDGHAASVAAPPGQARALAAGAWVGAALLAAVALHVAVGRWRFARLDRLMGAADYESAFRASGGFRLHPRLQPDAALAGALCLTALGRASEARARLLARAWHPARQAMRDFVLARAEALLGHREEATRWLASSLLADPRLIPQARADPALAALLPPTRPLAEEAYS
jgi:hypothetical protein